MSAQVNFRFRQVECVKRYPLTISRGTVSATVNLMVFAEADGVTGLGEMCPGALTGAATAEEGQRMLQRLIDTGLEGLSIEQVWRRGRELEVAPCALAGLDVALWDRRAKARHLPLHELLGLPMPTVPTSVTIGIESPQVIHDRVPEILERTGAKYLKVKLGSPEGIEADWDRYRAAKLAAEPFRVGIRVDANGGWSLEDAKTMVAWLAVQGAEYVEQPLPEGAEDQLPELFQSRTLPIYVDESCRFARDVPALAGRADGVNVKLMKCGGLTEALRIVDAARAHGLKTMIGCMSETSVSISAAASIGSLFDCIDLDSHLNLAPDPAEGAALIDGVVTPSGGCGHGATLKNA